MAEILKMLHFPEQHGVAEMQVGRRGIEARFNAQRPPGLRRFDQALAQLFFADQFRQAFLQVCELFVDGHSLFIRAGPA